MAKKARKVLGRFGSLKQRFTTEKLDALLRREKPAMVEAVAALVAEGKDPATHVLVLADMADEATRMIARELVGSSGAADNGFLGVLASTEAARVLRLYEATAQADDLARPLAAHHMRILHSAEGEVAIIDEPLS